MDLDYKLHPAQLEIFLDPSRFKVVVAGRRFGKSYLSAITCIVEGLKDKNEYGYDLKNTDIYYIAPTFQQGKDIMWRLIKDLAHPIAKSIHENTGVLQLVNDRRIHIKGSDRPDNLRGVGLSYVVLDEYASMKPETWEAIIRPTLSDVKGSALFIGTPAGKNHFYKLYQEASTMEDWATFQYMSVDNPFLDKMEIESSRKNMSHERFRQEHEASFQMGSGNLFNADHIVIQPDNEIYAGPIYMAVDPAGFTSVSKSSGTKFNNLDETAIAVVTMTEGGWVVEDIKCGRWSIRETSLQILRAAQQYRPLGVGIEKGSLKNALMPYLMDQCKRLHIFPRFLEVVHGNQKKTERIAWALQGRLQQGRIKFKNLPYLQQLKDQMMDFPNPMAHDDMLDALAYIDQVGKTTYTQVNVMDDFEVMDDVLGF